MPNQQVPPGQSARIPGIQGDDTSGNPEGLSSLTATIDDTVNAYVSVIDPTSLWMRNRGLLAQGTVKTITVTLNAKALNGSALPPLVVSLDILGPPAPPPATHLITGAITIESPTLVTDPGTATITLI